MRLHCIETHPAKKSDHLTDRHVYYLFVVNNVEEECLVAKVGIDHSASMRQTDCRIQRDGILDEPERDAQHVAVQCKEHRPVQKVDSTADNVILVVAE